MKLHIHRAAPDTVAAPVHLLDCLLAAYPWPAGATPFIDWAKDYLRRHPAVLLGQTDRYYLFELTDGTEVVLDSQTDLPRHTA